MMSWTRLAMNSERKRAAPKGATRSYVKPVLCNNIIPENAIGGNNVGIPQIIVITLLSTGIVIDALLHGKRHEAKHNFWLSFMKRMGTIGLLIWGGFFI